MDAHIRAYAWIHFAAANLARNIGHQVASSEADLMLAEFDKREFRPADEVNAVSGPTREELETRLEVVNKAQQFEQVNDLTRALQLPNETVPEVVQRLIAVFDAAPSSK
jgi:hypothetical protein